MSALNCDQCEMLSINGIACHERGCPNMGARWDGQQWIKQRTCFECGCTVDADSECCSAEPESDAAPRFTAPSCWASYLINGDDSGIEPDEKAQADAFIEWVGAGDPVSCEDAGFVHHHDARISCRVPQTC
jgi:hypothetical protein